jgi:hypothetical protein
MLHTQVSVLDDVLSAYSEVLGDDYTAYRNHTYRVLNLCAALTTRAPDALDKIAVAVAFHDLGIWSAGTFDYLEPSMQLARAHLVRANKTAWAPEIDAMILEHHKLSRYTSEPDWLVEPFRKADWIDVSLGMLTFGLPRGLIREISDVFPDAGFHARLAQLTLQRLRTHPLDPLPILRR